MPWQLEITVIDVGQGDSSLIIATNGVQTRSMLIDGGIGACARVVHDYVRARLAFHHAPRLDHLLVTHYDDDHVGGIGQLLRFDNLSAIAKTVADAATAGFGAAQAKSRGNKIAAAAAGAAAAARGGYGPVHAAVAVEAAARAADKEFTADRPDAFYASEGATIGSDYVDRQPLVSPWLIRTAQTVKKAATAGALRLIGGPGAGGTTASRVANAIGGAVPPSFWTDRAYASCQVVDTGALYEPDQWGALIGGHVLMWANDWRPAPGTNRTRCSLGTADLAREILWNSGPQAIPAPADAPAMFVVATRSNAWQGGNNYAPFGPFQPKNDQAIGLVLRFGNFFYYTGDDLPSVGEDLIGTAVMGNSFANPQGGAAFPAPHRIAAFKCGHHGADGSTSDTFLQTIDSRASLISCGLGQFGTGDPHPTQNVINRINARVPRFFLTNCKFYTDHIPGSGDQDQLTDVHNRSRVCGDNADNNLAAGRHRGDARLYLSEAESTAPDGAGRRFHVHYYDRDDNPNAMIGGVIGDRTEDILY